MDKLPHNLEPGYYWYTIAGDPPTVMHIHERGHATLMGTDFQMAPEDIADMVQKGETFILIEPPRLA